MISAYLHHLSIRMELFPFLELSYLLTPTLDSEVIDLFSKSVEPDNILGMGFFLFNVLATCSGSYPIGSDSGLHF